MQSNKRGRENREYQNVAEGDAKEANIKVLELNVETERASNKVQALYVGFC